MKIGVIGAGLVGSACAYSMVLKGIAREIILVDANSRRAAAEAEDILHAVPFADPCFVRAGEYADLAGADVVILTAGASQRPGEDRPALLSRNLVIIEDIVSRIMAVNPSAILIVVSNPVDALTHAATARALQAGASPARVFGSGTLLDTARLRVLLAGRLGVSPQHVHAYVLGEHGDSEVIAWSLVRVGGTLLSEFIRTYQTGRHALLQSWEDGSFRSEIEQTVRGAANRIIEGKGATCYGIGSAVAHLVQSIARDSRSILTVSAKVDAVLGYHEGTYSLPRLIGREGILETFPLSLDDLEKRQMKLSAEAINRSIAGN